MSESFDMSAAAPGPGVTLVLGPPNAGKLGQALTWWGGQRAGRPLIVAPTAAVAHEVTLEMVRRNGAVIGRSAALTFDGLVRDILGERPVYVSAFRRKLILTRLVRDLALPTLRPAARFPGLITVAGTLLQQLADSGKTAGEVEEILRLWARDDPSAADLAGDLRRLLARYRQECAAAGLLDRGDAVGMAPARLEGWENPVAFYGFTSFTAAQRRLVQGLAQRVPVLLTFDHERDRLVNLVGAGEVAGWEAVATRVVALPFQSQAYSSPDIAYLERQLARSAPLGTSAPETATPAPTEGPSSEVLGVHFLLSAGQRSEAESAAQHVVALLRQGFRPGEIAVVVRHVQARARLLGQVFASCGIPYRVDVGRTLIETGLGHAFLGAVRGLALAEPDSLLAYFRSPYSGSGPGEAADIEARYRRGAVRGTEALIELVDRLHPALLDTVRDGLVSGDDPARVVQRMRIRSARLGHAARQMLLAGLQGVSLDDEEAQADIRAYAALVHALAELEQIDTRAEHTGAARVGSAHAGDTDGGGADTRAVLDGLAGLQIAAAQAQDRDCVSILSPSRARARRFAAVLVLGLVEGEFPGKSEMPSLLTERQQSALEAAAGESLLASREEDEEALFLSAVSRAWQVLYLSARDTDDGGADVVPSRFWTRAKTLLGRGDDDHERRTLADVVFSVDGAPSLRHRRRARAAEAARAPGATDSWRRPPARLQDPAVLTELAALRCFSPSGLESYLACPLAWFLERVVGVEEATEELDARVIGSLLHDAAGRLYRALGSAGKLPLRPVGVPEAVCLGHTIVDQLLADDAYPGTAAEKRIASWRVKELVQVLLQMEGEAGSSFVLEGVEVPVGGGDGVDVGGFRIRGRVDRIDADPQDGSLFVVDYKTGKIPSAAHIGEEEALQLPLYLMALAAEREGTAIAGGAYLSPAHKKRSGVVLVGREGAVGIASAGEGNRKSGACRALTPAEVEELNTKVRDIAMGAVSAMRAGVIAPRADQSCPPWCALQTVCRTARKGARW